MSTTRTIRLDPRAGGAERELAVTRYALGGHPGGLGLQLGIGNRYTHLTRSERERLRLTLGELFPDEGWTASIEHPRLTPPAQSPLLARWHELVKRVPNDTSADITDDVLREAFQLRRECEQVTSDDPSYGTALWIAGRIRAEITLEDEPRSLVDQLAAAGNAAARGSLTTMAQDEVLGPVTVHPLTRDQVIEIARANWQDPVGFQDAILAHMHINDEEEYGPGVRERANEVLAVLRANVDEVLEAADPVEQHDTHAALDRLQHLLTRIPEDLR